MNAKQDVHQFGFLSDGRLPTIRISGAPPEKGAPAAVARLDLGYSASDYVR